jgi:prepilin peptidase CpaA
MKTRCTKRSFQIGKTTMTISAFAATVAMCVFAFTMIYACVSDLTTNKIRNGLVLIFLLAYAVLAPLTGFTASEIGWSAALAAGVLVVAFIFFAFGWMGGGDAKLIAVTALWFGTAHTPTYLVYTALLGGLFTLAILQFRTLTLPLFLQNKSWIARLHVRGSGVPYGVAMALAALIVFPETHWMAAMSGNLAFQ